MKKGQIVVVVAVVAVMGYLYTLPVKGLIKPKEASGHTNTADTRPATPVAAVSVEMVSSSAKLTIGPALAAQVTELERRLKNAGDDAAKLTLQKQLAKMWDDANQPGPAAFYYQDIASKEGGFTNWLTAGSHYNNAFKFTQDTLAQPSFVINAIACLKNAVKLKPDDLDAKTGLGIAYVNQTSLGMTDADGGSPMQGIMLLLDVVKQNPKNRNANMSLGLFAIKSGQYEKAVQRFKTIIAQTPNDVEPNFYLAECYRQLGMKKEAIEAYQKCKELMRDPAFDQRIDDDIKELKN